MFAVNVKMNMRASRTRATARFNEPLAQATKANKNISAHAYVNFAAKNSAPPT